jgi:signal transduction histidine kinase
MSWLWDTIAGRTLLVLVAGLALSVALSQFLYHHSLERALRESDAAQLAEKLVVLDQTLTRLNSDQRDDAAHALAGGPIDLHWSPDPLAIPTGASDVTTDRLREILKSKLQRLSDDDLLIGVGQKDASDLHASQQHGIDHVTLISMALSDGSWVNMSVAQVAQTSLLAPTLLPAVLLLAFCIVALAALMGRWLTKPLVQVADGARQLFAGQENVLVSAGGTREVRELATAFNDMQTRIKRLIDDRTNMLAAVSHDLRTPLTRLRLRAEALGDEPTRQSVLSDLADMEGMLDATLAFLRGDRSDEPVEMLDLGALLQSIVNDCEDAGGIASLRTVGQLTVRGRLLALKRAFTNLIQNAIRHGGSAEISARAAADDIEVNIEDRGPGISPDKLESVFEPFITLDGVRGQKAGGHGLGLSIARSHLQLHGGEVSLSNRAGGGLSVRVRLPRRLT